MERFVPTQLGLAVLSSSISPDEGLVVFSELRKARQCFVLENELHVIYQVKPVVSLLHFVSYHSLVGMYLYYVYIVNQYNRCFYVKDNYICFLGVFSYIVGKYLADQIMDNFIKHNKSEFSVQTYLMKIPSKI